MGKQKKFRDIWLNQTNLGARFGISAVQVGRKLREVGLRDDEGQPRPETLKAGYCRPTPLRDGTPFFLWNGDLVAERFKAAGLVERSPQEMQAQELAEQYLEAQELWNNGRDKVAGMIWDDLYREIKEADIALINRCLEEMGSKERLSWPLATD
jgi:hypothetical protein